MKDKMSTLIELIKRKPYFYTEKGADLTQIEQAEKALESKFSSDFKELLIAFGAVSFDGHDLTGFSVDKNLDVVEVTQKNRQKYIIEKGLYVIEEAHIDGIVIWQSPDGAIYETAPNSKPKKIANSLAEYVTM